MNQVALDLTQADDLAELEFRISNFQPSRGVIYGDGAAGWLEPVREEVLARLQKGDIPSAIAAEYSGWQESNLYLPHGEAESVITGWLNN